MRYAVRFKPRAEKDIERLPHNETLRILSKLEMLRDDLAGDVKRLTNFTPEFRLRVGKYRVLFEVQSTEIIVYRVVHRREAYEQM